MFVQTSMCVTDDKKTLAYYKIWPFAVNYESVMFYSTGPWSVNRKIVSNSSISKNLVDKAFIHILIVFIFSTLVRIRQLGNYSRIVV
jgi:hypothetical protein